MGVPEEKAWWSLQQVETQAGLPLLTDRQREPRDSDIYQSPGMCPTTIMLWINPVHPNFRETDRQILLEAILSGRRSLHESRWVYLTCQTASPGLLCNLLLKSQTSLASQGQVVSRPTGSTRGWPWSLVWVTRAQA